MNFVFDLQFWLSFAGSIVRNTLHDFKGAMSPVCSINLRGQKPCLCWWQPKIIVQFFLKSTLLVRWKCTAVSVAFEKCLWPRMARMETDRNLKKIGPLYSSFSSGLAKPAINWSCLVLLSIIHFISSSWIFKTILRARKCSLVWFEKILTQGITNTWHNPFKDSCWNETLQLNVF